MAFFLQEFKTDYARASNDGSQRTTMSGVAGELPEIITTAWSSGAFDPPMLAVARKDGQVHLFTEEVRSTFAVFFARYRA